MTDQTRFRAALCISLFLHFMLLRAHWTPIASSGPGTSGRLSQEIHSPALLFLNNEGGLAVEHVTETLNPGSGDDKRQQEQAAYSEAVSEAIHARRFVAAEATRALIGLARFSFTSMPDGRFHNVVLAASSGNPLLDRAAEAALRSASGVVARPPSLGREEIVLEIAVKYQYDW